MFVYIHHTYIYLFVYIYLDDISLYSDTLFFYFPYSHAQNSLFLPSTTLLHFPIDVVVLSKETLILD